MGADGAPKAKKENGQERSLVDVLRDVCKYMTQDMKDRSMAKDLHGAMTELAKPEGILSVTSLNQLVHNTQFSMAPFDICLIFVNIHPLLQKMND